MPRFRIFIALAVCGLAAAGSPARAQTPDAPVITTEAYHYIPGDLRSPTIGLQIDRGETLHYLNLDPIGGFHTITAEDVDNQGNPIFDTGVRPVAPGSLADVIGTDTLQPGTYLFYCSVHGANLMEGKLIVN